MRGKDQLLDLTYAVHGITPAYAGKSLGYGQTEFPYEDHPCICGEKNCLLQKLGITIGSPLHMRGKDSLITLFFSSVGITPAYAGKSFSKFLDQFKSQDHPCICGEKRDCRTSAKHFIGSPLHMRGKGIWFIFAPISSRITPAYAGKSGLFKSLSLRS